MKITCNLDVAFLVRMGRRNTYTLLHFCIIAETNMARKEPPTFAFFSHNCHSFFVTCSYQRSRHIQNILLLLCVWAQPLMTIRFVCFTKHSPLAIALMTSLRGSIPDLQFPWFKVIRRAQLNTPKVTCLFVWTFRSRQACPKTTRSESMNISASTKMSTDRPIPAGHPASVNNKHGDFFWLLANRVCCPSVTTKSATQKIPCELRPFSKISTYESWWLPSRTLTRSGKWSQREFGGKSANRRQILQECCNRQRSNACFRPNLGA